MAYLELNNIKKSYYLGREEFPVLKGINLKFELGEFVSILGESGGGKSTLMNIIGGLDREFKGSVSIDGKRLNHKDEKSLDKYRRETIGYIYQSYNLISHLSILDNVLISLDMTTLSKTEREKRAKSLLERVGLSEQINKYPNQLSGGQKQRVAIARALASDPKVIIADEPTGALDSQNTKEVLEILDQIASEGRLVIAVTHSQEVANSGTRIVELVDGKIAKERILRDKYPINGNAPQMQSKPLPGIVSYKTAFKHFKYNFWRNFLIVVGTAIGLFAVILFSGLGNGISGYIDKQITDVANPQVVQVSRYQKSSTAQGPGGGSGPSQMMSSSGNTPQFTNTQEKQIKDTKHINSVENMYSINNVSIKQGSKTVIAPTITNWTKSSTVSSIDVGHKPGKGEIVLDEKAVAKKLSKNNWKKLVGKTVQLSYTSQDVNGTNVNLKYNVKIAGIGKSANSMQSMNTINTKTLTDQMRSNNISTKSSKLAVKVDNLNNVKSVNKKINNLKKDNKRLYQATSVTSIIGTIQTYVNLASTILAAIAGISLVVSALMIIVTMYMSVSSRTKEIGILRALGESKKDIKRLFISESLIIGVLSAVLATVLAVGLGAVANGLLASIASYKFIQISFMNILVTFVIAIVISLIAALLPARHAASLNPIDALSAD